MSQELSSLRATGRRSPSSSANHTEPCPPRPQLTHQPVMGHPLGIPFGSLVGFLQALPFAPYRPLGRRVALDVKVQGLDLARGLVIQVVLYEVEQDRGGVRVPFGLGRLRSGFAGHFGLDSILTPTARPGRL